MTEMMNEKRVGQEKNRQQPKAERKRDADEVSSLLLSWLRQMKLETEGLGICPRSN